MGEKKTLIKKFQDGGKVTLLNTKKEKTSPKSTIRDFIEYKTKVEGDLNMEKKTVRRFQRIQRNFGESAF